MIEEGRIHLYITERAVFQLTQEGLELIEVAPGIDVEKDIISKMEFEPKISKKLKIMDERLFKKTRMGIGEEIRERLRH